MRATGSPHTIDRQRGDLWLVGGSVRQDHLRGGNFEQANFNDYRIIRIDEMPLIELYVVSSTENSGGIGGPGNAVTRRFLATQESGRRARLTEDGR
jgi:hypothetical protein